MRRRRSIMLIASINALTVLLSIGTLPVSGYLIYLSCRSIAKNNLEKREKQAAYAILILFCLVFMISAFNVLIQTLTYLNVPGRHNVSIVRSFTTQVAALLTLYLYKKI